MGGPHPHSLGGTMVPSLGATGLWGPGRAEVESL